MDPTGGINPSNPRLDTTPQPNQPISSGVPAPAPITAPTLESPAPAVIPQPIAQPDMSLGFDQSMAALPPNGASGTGKVKLIILVAIGIALLLAIAAGAYFTGFASGKTSGKKEADAEYQRKQAEAQQAETEEEGGESEISSELELGALQDPKYIDETIEGEVGQQASSSDGFVLKIVNVERNYKSTDANYKLDSTKELVKVNFLIGNITKDKPKDISSFNFRLENSANAQLTPENIAEYPDKFDTVKLDPGAQSKGSIVYAVNKDEKPLKFIREQRYRISGENREVTTRIVITIAE